MKVLRITLEHPFEITFGALFAFVGLALFGSTFDVEFTTVQDGLPFALLLMWATCLTLGGPAVVYGICQRSPAGRAIEIAGLSLSAAAWSTYALTLASVSTNSKGTVAISFGVAVTIACVLRIVALRKVNRVLAVVARVANEEG